MKKWLLVLCIAAQPLFSLGGNDEWIKHSETVDFVVYYQKVACDDVQNGLFQDMLLLKIENKRPTAFKASWDLATWYDGASWGYGDLRFEVNLPANGTVIGDCGNKALSIFVEFRNHPDVPKLTDFALENVQITNLK